jgi:hypothetical protein
MTRHYLGLTDASVLATRHLLLTEQAIADLIETEAMGAIVGPAGLGKTFAIDHALEQHSGPVITLTFEARPTMRLVADRLLANLTGAPGRGTRFAMTDQLMNRLSQRPRLIVRRPPTSQRLARPRARSLSSPRSSSRSPPAPSGDPAAGLHVCTGGRTPKDSGN